MRARLACMVAGSCLACTQAAIATEDPVIHLPTGPVAMSAGPNPMAMMMPAASPNGVGGGRVIKPGQLMLSYRYVRTQKNKLLMGDDGVSPTKVATMRNHFAERPGQPATYRSAPEHMTMQAHLFGAQVGLTDDLSAMIGIPYVIKERTAVTFEGPTGTTELGTFENKTSGIGDVAVSLLYKLHDDPIHHLHLMAGLSFPTGSIRKDGKTLQPDGTTSRRRLAYGLQLGTGTYNLLPGLTYWGAHGDWHWGAQAMGQINLGENDEGYTVGDRACVTGWGGYTLGYGFTTSLRLSQEYTGDIDGNDNSIMGASSTTDPNNYGGWKTLASLGLDYRVPGGPLKGVNPGIEFTLPLYQNLNGPQLSDAWTLSVGVRKVFTF